MSLRLFHFSILPSAGLARVAAAFGKYEWLLFLHMTGAFLFLGAAVASLIFTFASQRYERPSEIALILRLAGVTSFRRSRSAGSSCSSSGSGSSTKRATTTPTPG